ncbi:mitotic-spindle organizing protein 2-like isoform X2 [Entelurus aequoreus]|uniref:mitotic-spindle organizing protein 2-like isoform X2 n=1 Tax=Entelurus aequoreus TaxID=161455 RepID=UPI002B1DFDD1|nr:mitotic-spindle organizing protein 2-like isoform X2 [Entelurus aequoreus]
MSQQVGHPASDNPALVVTSNVHQYSMKKKKVLNAEDSELFELSQAAGISVDQEVFKIMVDLLKMNVAPQAVFETLKAMSAGQKFPESSSGDCASTSHGPGVPPATAEARDECSLSGRSPKLPAASGPRAARVSTKIVVYGPQDVNSQVRSKASAAPTCSASHSEKSREASSQRVQRQPSATRGQKTKSSGSSSSSSQMNST